MQTDPVAGARGTELELPAPGEWVEAKLSSDIVIPSFTKDASRHMEPSEMANRMNERLPRNNYKIRRAWAAMLQPISCSCMPEIRRSLAQQPGFRPLLLANVTSFWRWHLNADVRTSPDFLQEVGVTISVERPPRALRVAPLGTAGIDQGSHAGSPHCAPPSCAHRPLPPWATMSPAPKLNLRIAIASNLLALRLSATPYAKQSSCQLWRWGCRPEPRAARLCFVQVASAGGRFPRCTSLAGLKDYLLG